MMGPFMGGQLGDRRIAIGGQSNSVGLAYRTDITDASLAAMYDTPFARVFIFNPTTNNYEPLQMGVNNLGDPNNQFGLEFGLAVRWTRETHRSILYIDKHGVDGQQISYFQSGTSFFTEALRRCAAQNAWLAANARRPRAAGWVWVQGESDDTNTQAYYQAALTTLVNDRIANGLQSAIDIRLIVQMLAGTLMYNADIAAAKTAYGAANVQQTKLVTMAPFFNSDNLHLNARGQTQLGYDTFELLLNKPHLPAR